MAVSDDQLHARTSCRADHRLTLVDRQGHRLLDEHVLTGSRGDPYVLGMELMRGRDVDRFDRVIVAQRLDRVVCASAEIRLELTARFGTRVRSARQLDAFVGDEGRQHQRERAAEADDTETDLTNGCHPE